MASKIKSDAKSASKGAETKRIRKILIANRGEIAVRVMETANAMGFRTVAVYSEADRNALHVRMADESVLIGAAPVAESYLDPQKILAAAKKTGADAIHPGYGFLSENAEFARSCVDAGLIFIGPPADAIDLMGNKRAAKIAVREHLVPCVPGYDGTDQSDETLIEEAHKIGFPIMVKAAAGGGGRGMRLVSVSAELPDALRSARSEAASAFVSDELILEKAIIRPRHVEVQIFADQHGNIVHLGERDCSVQRRHQKVVEESPSPAVNKDLRQAMGMAAVNAARSCGYLGAGTVEFLLTEEGKFYFLEMNTRLQVEHPVTEMVTGTDLVEWQILVAEGKELPVSQSEVSWDGHAIETRIYAEDPGQDFMPQTGSILLWEGAEGPYVRIDSGIESGTEVSPFYDPMIAKLIVWGENRETACRLMADALDRSVLLGLRTNRSFLRDIVMLDEFVAGNATTAFLTDHDLLAQEARDELDGWALAALLAYLRSAGRVSGDPQWFGWSTSGAIPSTIQIRQDDERKIISVVARGKGVSGYGFDVSIPVPEQENKVYSFEISAADEDALDYLIDGASKSLRYAWQGTTVHHSAGDGNGYTECGSEPPKTEDGAGSGLLKAPLDGSVMELFVKVGDRVTVGQKMMVLEAMKMEHPVKADVDGVLEELLVKQGDQAKTRQLLAVIEPDETE